MGIENINKIRNKQDADLSVHLFGKVPPQAKDLEESVLGAMMIEKVGLLKVFGILTAEMFYFDAHKKIFKACQDLFQKSSPVDILTVTSNLRSNGELENVGGAYFVAELTSSVASAANIEFHAYVVYEKYIQREIIKLSSQAVKSAFEDTVDCFELLKDMTRELLNLQNVKSQKNTDPSYRANKAIQQIELAMNGKELMGVPAGLSAIDTLTGGWQNQDLIVIGARPGAGKSALAITLAKNADVAGFPTWIFSLEMSDTQIAMREIGMASNIKYSRLRTGKISDSEFTDVVAKLDEVANSKIYVDSESRLNTSVLIAKLSKAIMEKDIKLAIVDYLNLMDSETKSSNRYEKITNIVCDLKRAAKQLDIPIILLAQLNRDVEKQTDKRPQLHHLKDSGAIEEYSDIIMLLYRPAYYDENAVDAEGNSEKDVLYIDIAKHKQGATGDVKLYCEIDKNIIKDINTPFQSFKPKGEFIDITQPKITEDVPF